MSRKAPTVSTLRRLFALSGNQCAFPDCTHALVDEEGTYIAQLCHIEAAEFGGERYNEKQTDEERRAFENLLLLCHGHHKKTDNITLYKVDDLHQIKKNHEQQFFNNRYELNDETLDQVIDSISKKLDYIIEQNNQTHLSLDNITQEIGFISSNQTGFSTNRESLYNDMLKIGIEFRNDKNFTAALSFFQKLDRDNQNELSDEVRFKLLANTGVTLLDMGRNKEAASYFLRIMQLDLHTLESISYICLAYAILKEQEKFDYFFDKAITLGKDNVNLWLAYLLCKGGIIPTSKLHEKIPENLLNSNLIIIKLLELYNSEGRLPEFKELIWKIEASIVMEDYQEWQIIKSYVSLTVSSILTVEKLQLMIFNDHEFEAVEKAINLYNKIIVLLENSGAIKMLSITFYNRALCYMALSKDAEAERDLERSWIIDPYFSSFKGLFLFHLKNERFGRCELLLEEWKQKQINTGADELFNTMACEARLLSKKGDLVRLEAVLIDAYDKMPLEYKPLVLDNLVLNCVGADDYSLVMKYSNKLITDFPEYVYGYIGLFAYHMKKKEFLEALNALKDARNKKYDHRSEAFIWMQLADGFCELKEYNEALIYFEKLEQYNALNALTPRFAECHYYLGNYDKVVILLGERNFDNLDTTSQQLLFWSYYKLDLKKELEDVLEQGLKLKISKDVNLFRKLGSIYYSENDQFREAASVILSIDDFKNFDVLEAFELAGLLSSMGYAREAFDLAYKLRIIYYDTFEAHKYYLDLFIHHRNFFKNKELYLKRVEENTLVVLKDASNREYNKYYLAGDNKISSGVSLESGDQLWNVFLGIIKGKEVKLPNTVGTFEVYEIWSKHLVSFRDSMFLLQNKYADKAGMYFA